MIGNCDRGIEIKRSIELQQFEIPQFGREKPYIGKEDKFQESSVTVVNHHFEFYEAFHVPNGGKRNKIVAAKLKRQGTKSGVSDWIILKPNEKYHGLIIELKTAKRVRKELKRGIEYKIEYGTIQQSQIDFLTQMIKNGYFGCIIWNLSELRKIITKYINNEL